MTRLFFLMGLLAMSFNGLTQDRFSYVSDRRFFEPSDLIGYQFVPHGIEVPGKFETDLYPGEYSFGISSNNLYVVGEEIQGVFSISTINATEFGFKLDLINARNPTMQGHLKVIMTKSNHIEAIVFKRSKLESEMVFFLPKISPEEKASDKEHFTDYGEVIVPHPDNLWGLQLNPFFRVDSNRKTQQRLTPADSVEITFIEEIEIIEKIKKAKKVKPAKKKDQNEEVGAEEEEAITEEVEEMEVPAWEEDDAAVPPITKEMAENGPRIKTKIIKKYFVNIKSLIANEDGTSTVKNMKIPVFKVLEREDETAGPGEERFQIAMESYKGNTLFLYLTEERKVTALEMGTTRYELRY